MVYVFQGCWSPLQIAIFNGHLDVVKTLIEAGANVNHTDKVWGQWHCCNTSAQLMRPRGTSRNKKGEVVDTRGEAGPLPTHSAQMQFAVPKQGPGGCFVCCWFINTVLCLCQLSK